MNPSIDVEAGSLPSPCRSIAYVRGKRTKGRVPAPRPCEGCETIFTPIKENPEKPARFCCDKCRSAAWRGEQKRRGSIKDIVRRLSAIEKHLGIGGDR
ncbi:MAG: hypothetical protein WC331_11445 [Candidatus Omnitrophota bacterium]